MSRRSLTAFLVPAISLALAAAAMAQRRPTIAIMPAQHTQPRREHSMNSTAVTGPATGPAAAENRPSASPRVGMLPPFDLLDRGPGAAGAFLAQAAEAGIDHVCCGDHVSFITGMGFDGLVQATALAMLHPALPIYSGVYLLPLRHPVLVARQLADIARLIEAQSQLRPLVPSDVLARLV